MSYLVPCGSCRCGRHGKAALRDQAEHGEGHNPAAEAGEAELSDAEAEYGEPDRLGSTARAEEQGEDEGEAGE